MAQMQHQHQQQQMQLQAMAAPVSASPFPHPVPMPQNAMGTPPMGVVVQPPGMPASPFVLGTGAPQQHPHQGSPYVSGVSPTATFVPGSSQGSPFLGTPPGAPPAPALVAMQAPGARPVVISPAVPAAPATPIARRVPQSPGDMATPELRGRLLRASGATEEASSPSGRPARASRERS
eukprot:5263137-Alexandrium_andersonii.AAC.1